MAGAEPRYGTSAKRVPVCFWSDAVTRWALAIWMAAEAISGWALSQSINPGRSFAGKPFLEKRTHGLSASGEIGVKSFTTSYGSEYKAPLSTCTDRPPTTIV